MFACRKWLTIKQGKEWRSENGYCMLVSSDIIVITVHGYWYNFCTCTERSETAIGRVGAKVVVETRYK